MALTGDTLDFVQGGIVTSSAQIVDNGATTGDVLTVQADKSIAAAPGGGSQAGVMARAIRTFTETAGAGIYTATVVVPQYAMVYTVGLVIVDGPWDADSVSLDAGDTQDPKGYWDGYDFNSVSVYDPSTANIDASSGAAAPGFDGGNYFSGGPTNGDLWGGGVSQNGNAPVYYHAAGDTITLALTTTGAGGTTGRLHAVVVGTDVPAGIAAAVKA